MLVLSRKAGEKILIGSDVKVTIIRIGPSSVRVGIEAPDNLNIVREELCLGEGAVVCAAEGSEEAHGPGYPR